MVYTIDMEGVSINVAPGRGYDLFEVWELCNFFQAPLMENRCFELLYASSARDAGWVMFAIASQKDDVVLAELALGQLDAASESLGRKKA